MSSAQGLYNEVFSANFPIVDIDKKLIILENAWFVCTDVKMFKFFNTRIFFKVSGEKVQPVINFYNHLSILGNN